MQKSKLFFLLVLLVATHIQSMEGDAILVDLEESRGQAHYSGYQEIHDGTAQHMVNTLFADIPGDHKPLLDLLEDELSKNPALGLQLSQRGAGEESMNKKLLLTGRVFAHMLLKTNEEKKQTNEEKELAKKEAVRQKEKVGQKKEQLQKEEKKSFWSIVSAVGAAVLAVASTAWGAIEATGSEHVVVEVICNCTT